VQYHLGGLWLLLGNEGIWGGKFSHPHYYSLGWSCLRNFIEISQAVCRPDQVENFADKTDTGIDPDSIAKNKGCLAAPANKSHGTHLVTRS